MVAVNKNLMKLLVFLALGVVICSPGLAFGTYVESWYENGLYGYLRLPPKPGTSRGFFAERRLLGRHRLRSDFFAEAGRPR